MIKRYSKKLLVTLGGVSVLLLGLILALPGVPGPGLAIMLAGLAILASEYVWAQHLLEKLERKATQLKDKALSNVRKAKSAKPPKTK